VKEVNRVHTFYVIFYSFGIKLLQKIYDYKEYYIKGEYKMDLRKKS
jgi:hypothetical protein